ncbi:DUF6503 family protein [Winogradskyella aurantiaca]|uniref:DUF6503 family protein n=1 Tax=Winogradskyella aurantiaca TaxID=2219558 RepID=UPI000E1DFE4F|nr:DUF6503 family protein [Winogradskyella aurantiaca]
MKHIIKVFLIVLLASCQESKQKDLPDSEQVSAQEIIDKTIEASGGNNFGRSNIGFYFRDVYYTARRYKGDFSLSRINTISGDSVIDILSNDGFARFINNEFQVIPDSMGVKYTASVNSVHYFSVLPYGLNDAAVIKQLLKTETIKNKEYYKIKVTFKENGGGEDYDDVFIYWINSETYKTDYLAYSYAEEDGIGLRFRAAFNERFIKGLRFVDYNNYKPKDKALNLENLGQQYSRDQLELLSTIELEQLSVNLIDLN